MLTSKVATTGITRIDLAVAKRLSNIPIVLSANLEKIRMQAVLV